MKRLTLLRHAKPERDSPTGRDLDRPLSERGRTDATRLGQEIRDLGLVFDLVLASPAKRVVETIKAIGGLSPTCDERIYNASPGELLSIVQQVDGHVESLMLVGHNPGFEELASMLGGNPVGMSAGALLQVGLPIDDWRDAGNDRGRLVRHINPEDWN